MSSFISYFSQLFRRPAKRYRILMIGLDYAGKTTILNQLNLGEIRTIIPAIGSYLEQVESREYEIFAWDVGGSDMLNDPYLQYRQNISGIIFVVDSHDIERLTPNGRRSSAYEEIRKVLNMTELKECPLLIYANKQDLPESRPVQEISELLNIDELKATNRVHIQGCNALERRGLQDGFNWLTRMFDTI